MKDLLSELVIVEDEIVGLETQIDQLRQDVRNEKEASKELKAKQSSQLRNNTSSMTRLNHQQQNNDQKMGFETRALHFISKAINGYSLTDFTINEKNVESRTAVGGGGNLSPYIQHAKQSGVQDQRSIKRSGILKPSASPLRTFRDPTPFKVIFNFIYTYFMSSLSCL